MLKIQEIFVSVQGEGLNIGIPMTFIRLHGCSMGCNFCDTKETWKSDIYKEMPIHEIMTAVLAHKVRWACITGGEPMEQDIMELILALKAAGIAVALETNGSIFNQEIIEECNWVAVSPKGVIPEQWKDFSYIDEMKIVIQKGNVNEFIQVWSFLRENEVLLSTPLFLQPCNNDKDIASRICDFVIGNPWFRLGYQMHKSYQLR